MKKQYLFLHALLTACAYLSMAAQDDFFKKLKQQNYGLWAAHNFCQFAFDGSHKFALAQKAAELGLGHVLPIPENKEWLIQLGNKVFKGTRSCGILYIVDYKEGDGYGLQAQKKALADNRVYSFFSDGSMGLGKEQFLKKSFISDTQSIVYLSRRSLTQSSGVKKVHTSKVKKENRGLKEELI